ncbi:unnamed protein product, partial [marine sediment metagenome]
VVLIITKNEIIKIKKSIRLLNMDQKIETNGVEGEKNETNRVEGEKNPGREEWTTEKFSKSMIDDGYHTTGYNYYNSAWREISYTTVNK